MRSTLFVSAILAALFLCSGQARAALHVCNGTNEVASVSIAALSQGSTGVEARSVGWWQINALQCETIVDADLDPGTLYYLFAKSQTIFWTGNPGKASKDAAFCTNFAGGFTYLDRPSTL